MSGHPRWWRIKADKERLERLRNKSELHKQVVRELRKQFGYDKVVEFKPLKHYDNVEFRDIWLPDLNICVKFYDDTPEGAEYIYKFRGIFRTFKTSAIRSNSTLEGTLEVISMSIGQQIEYLSIYRA